MGTRKYIRKFNPCVEVYDENQHKDFLFKFNCGNLIFNDYITKNEVIEDRDNGDGVTYLVFDKVGIFKRKLVGYYTLCATSIPFVSHLHLEPEDVVDGKEYDDKLYGVNAVQIKMFAVDKEYQNIFYEHGGFDMPIAAWILRYIIDAIDNMSSKVCGVKAIFLHAVDDAKLFYNKNGFEYTDDRIQNFDSDDDELPAMFFKLREIKIVYDD